MLSRRFQSNKKVPDTKASPIIVRVGHENFSNGVLLMDRGVEVVRYFPERGKFVMLAVGCAMLGLACLGKVITEGASTSAILGAGFFLFGSLNCAQSLDKARCYIELSPEGFLERSPLRRRLVRWSEVDSFELIPLPRRYCWVGYRLADCENPRIPSWVRRARRKDINLSDTYGLDAEELVELLNTWQRRFGRLSPSRHSG